jgi:membrane associated rhomboid family serine protease
VLVVLILLAAGGFAVYRATTPEERERFLEEQIRPLADAADRVILATTPCRAALVARTPRIVLTPVLAGLNLVLFVTMLFGDGSMSEPATLIGWGASHGPHTTNGEWWRLVTAMFVQPGLFHLLFTLIGLVQVAELLERIVGPLLVAVVYFSAGMLGGLVGLSDDRLTVQFGASPAIFGLYGLLLAVTAWTTLRRTGLTISLPVFKTLAPGAALFFVDASVSHGFTSGPDLMGFAAGAVVGLALTVNVGEKKPAMMPPAIAMAAALALMIYIALPLRGTVDVRPQLTEIVLKEDRTAEMYRAAVGRFIRSQRPVDTRVLVALINGTILPQLAAERSRVAAIDRALPDHQPFVDSASEYLRLRETSWQLRAQALAKGKADALKEAERLEQSSFAALQKLRRLRLAA